MLHIRGMCRSVTDETREESWVQTLKGHVCYYRQQRALGVHVVGRSFFWKLSGVQTILECAGYRAGHGILEP